MIKPFNFFFFFIKNVIAIYNESKQADGFDFAEYMKKY